MKVRFQGPIEKTVLDQHWATRPEIDAMLAELEAWSERPDTFMMFVLCWALGWVPA